MTFRTMFRAITALSLLGFAQSGCGGHSSQPVDPDGTRGPSWHAPASSAAAVDSLVSMWNRRGDERYGELFTDDYEFEAAR